MRTDAPRLCAAALLFLFCASLVLGGCSGRGARRTEDVSETPSATDPSVMSGYTVAHFPSFELEVPENWSVRGNVGKLYEGDGMFLLAGPLDSSGDALLSLEAELSKELELFFNTEYYRSQTRFDYDEQSFGGALRRVSGTLQNDRNGTSMRFSGAYSTAPGSYFVYFWPDTSGDRAGTRRMEVSYESYRVL